MTSTNLPRGVGEAMAKDDHEGLRQIPRQGIAHLNRGAERRGPVGEHLREVFARMPVTGEEQGHAMPVPRRDDPGGEDSRALRDAAGGGGPDVGPARRARQAQDGHRGVIVVQHVALGGLANQFVQRWLSGRRRGRHDLPLRGRWQRDRQGGLQPFEPMKRDATAVLEERDHARRGGVVLLRADAGRRVRGEDLAAQIAAQLFERVDGRRQRRLAAEPDQHARLALRVDLALGTARAPIPVFHARMRDVDVLGAGVRLGSMAPMPARRRCIGAPVLMSAGRRPRGGVPARRRPLLADAIQDGARLLGGRAEEELPQPGNRRRLVLDQLRDVPERLDCGVEQRELGVREGGLPGARDHALELRQVELDPAPRGRQVSPR